MMNMRPEFVAIDMSPAVSTAVEKVRRAVSIDEWTSIVSKAEANCDNCEANEGNDKRAKQVDDE
jgi:hypothetical protein